eukprot:COSAG02_NODE_22745_length_741_cov_1.258567_1_plen_113_part_10
MRDSVRLVSKKWRLLLNDVDLLGTPGAVQRRVVREPDGRVQQVALRLRRPRQLYACDPPPANLRKFVCSGDRPRCDVPLLASLCHILRHGSNDQGSTRDVDIILCVQPTPVRF